MINRKINKIKIWFKKIVNCLILLIREEITILFNVIFFKFANQQKNAIIKSIHPKVKL